MNYKNKQCPVCKNLFKDGDDIVVCPDCGAPYHRECYNEKKKCIYEDKHGTGFSYIVNEEVPQNDINKEKSEQSKNLCPRCHSLNPSDANFCNNCGFWLGEKGEPSNDIPPGVPNISVMFDPMGGVDPNEEIGEVKFGDIAKLVKNNSPYYMRVFKKIKDNNKSKFNFSAFFFSGAWFLYRKQYKLGVMIIILELAFMIPSSILTYMQSTSALLTPYTGPLWLLEACDTLLMVLCGVFANRLYLKNCMKKVKAIKEKSLNDDNFDYSKKLSEQGGVNTKILFLLLLCYLVIEYLPIFLR